jgi:hypothetical protein
VTEDIDRLSHRHEVKSSMIPCAIDRGLVRAQDRWYGSQLRL